MKELPRHNHRHLTLDFRICGETPTILGASSQHLKLPPPLTPCGHDLNDGRDTLPRGFRRSLASESPISPARLSSGAGRGDAPGRPGTGSTGGSAAEPRTRTISTGAPPPPTPTPRLVHRVRPVDDELVALQLLAMEAEAGLECVIIREVHVAMRFPIARLLIDGEADVCDLFRAMMIDSK